MDKSEIQRALKELFPHGHEDYIPTALEELDLHSRKNFDYASGGDSLGNFKRIATIMSLYPGIRPGIPQYPVALVLIYALKQLDQVLWSISRGWEGQVEGMKARLLDLSVFAKIAAILLKEKTS